MKPELRAELAAVLARQAGEVPTDVRLEAVDAALAELAQWQRNRMRVRLVADLCNVVHTDRCRPDQGPPPDHGPYGHEREAGVLADALLDLGWILGDTAPADRPAPGVGSGS